MITLTFIGVIIVFIGRYHARKLMHDKEKAIMHEQYIQDLLNTRLEIQKQTMEEIGRDIHDNVGQRLTLASIHANSLAHDDKYPQITETVSAISGILNESLNELRALSKNLTHASVDFNELRSLLEVEFERVNALNICKVSQSFGGQNFRVSATVKTVILRIIQEFIQNSLKYSGCSGIGISLQYDDRGLRIEASDNGHGFDMKEYERRENKGIGLTNMKKRASLIGAEFSFRSAIKEGTKLSIFIPPENLNAS